jgi:tripartite-type tricarboxylate transporter receptor subunit TctC
MRTSVLIAAALAAACMQLASIGARAADWPASTVRMEVPFPPGGATDQIARLLADYLGNRYKQRFVVENKAGADTVIGTDAVAKAAPDGLTILLTTAPYSIVAALRGSELPYDPVKDLVPVVRIAQNPMLLVAGPSAPAATVQDMLRISREKPGSLLVAAAGTMGTSTMSGELLASMGKVSTTIVPYKGTGPIMSDLMGGTVQYLFDNPASSMPMVKSGKLRAIAITGKIRSAALPDVPTVAESGLPGYEIVNWYGLFLPAGTPQAIQASLNQAVNDFIKQPDALKMLAENSIDPVGGSQAEFADRVRADIATWKQVAKERNIKVD